MADPHRPHPPPPPPSAPSLQMQGTLLFAVLMNAALFGLVTQQFYSYWICGFRDPAYLRLFVIVQYVLVAFQSALMWNLSYNLFIVAFSSPQSASPASLWGGPANSLCQLFIIFLANLSLASRIKALAKSRVQAATVVALSMLAFVLGMITIVAAWLMPQASSYTRYTSSFWHAIQALAECLITFFLSRALLKARSGIRESDSVVFYLVRNVIQIGLIATTWALAALVTWYFLPKNATYRIFDITSGSVYTQAMFEGLLSRTRLREHMTHTSSYLNVEMNSQSQASRRFANSLKWARASPAPSDVPEPERGGPSMASTGEDFQMESLSTGKVDDLLERNLTR